MRKIHIYTGILKSILDMHCLQDDLDKLQDWEQNWDMEFHPQKCKLLSITNKTKPNTEYNIYGETLESVETKIPWTDTTQT